MIALRLDPNGEVTKLKLTAGKSLHQMYESIGCNAVDVVRLTTQLDMWIDDEGIYTQKINPVATALAQRFGKVYQLYHGPAVIAGMSPEGDTIGLTGDQLVALLRALSDIAG